VLHTTLYHPFHHHFFPLATFVLVSVIDIDYLSAILEE
jgi:hypothetical protein